MLESSLAPRTRFDINFRIGDIPVRIHPFFWLGTVVLGLDLSRRGADILTYLAVWIALVFVSILVHELGHILMGRYFGCDGEIALTGFGGLAIGSSGQPERWQRNLVSLAGPMAGFLFAAVAVAGFWLYNPNVALGILGDLFHVDVPPADVPPLVGFAMLNLLFINIFWGLVNLLPIWPLDGGQICREVCESYRGREGVRLSVGISLGTAAAFAALALVEKLRDQPLVPFISFGKSWFPVLFFAILAFVNWQVLQLIRRAGLDWDEPDNEPRAPWEQDADWWKRGGSPWRD